jgi:hypothetical protein
MTHVTLEDQPAAVRDFFLNLPTGPDGSVVEMNGQPVAWVLPPSASANRLKDLTWTSEHNRRRCELIDRKYTDGLTPPEEVELAELQAAMHRFVDTIAPLPIDAARKLHQELMEKAMRNGADS